MGCFITADCSIARSACVALLADTRRELVIGRADCVRATQVCAASVHTVFDAVLVELTDFVTLAVCIGCALVLWSTASQQVFRTSIKTGFALTAGRVINGYALGVRTTANSLTHIETVEDTFASGRTDLIIFAFAVGLAQVGGTGTAQVTHYSSVALKTFALRSVVTTNTVGAFGTAVAKADINAISDVLVGQNALLIGRALVVSVAEMLGWLLTASKGIPYEAGQTLTDGLMPFSDTVSVETASHVLTNVGAVLQSVGHSPTCLAVGATGVVSAGDL